jgi:hypothetical protein
MFFRERPRGVRLRPHGGVGRPLVGRAWGRLARGNGIRPPAQERMGGAIGASPSAPGSPALRASTRSSGPMLPGPGLRAGWPPGVGRAPRARALCPSSRPRSCRRPPIEVSPGQADAGRARWRTHRAEVSSIKTGRQTLRVEPEVGGQGGSDPKSRAVLGRLSRADLRSVAGAV